MCKVVEFNYNAITSKKSLEGNLLTQKCSLNQENIKLIYNHNWVISKTGWKEQINMKYMKP